MAILIRSDYGEGGAGVGATKSAQHARIAEVLRGLVDNDTARTPATIASADAPAAAGSYTQADIQDMVDLLNEIKGALNAASGSALAVDKAAF